MICKRLVMTVCVALALTACAGPRYAIADREPVDATAPLALPGWPDASLLICPRGHWDPAARCPWGSEWIGYDADAAQTIEEFVVAAQANADIATTQAAQIRALDAEAAAANDTAAALELRLADEQQGRAVERIGWTLVVGSILLLAL